MPARRASTRTTRGQKPLEAPEHARGERPAAEPSPAAEQQAPATVVEEQPAAQPSPAAESQTPATEEQPAAELSPAAEPQAPATVVEEQPAAQPSPAAESQTPATEEQPVAELSPAAESQPPANPLVGGETDDESRFVPLPPLLVRENTLIPDVLWGAPTDPPRLVRETVAQMSGDDTDEEVEAQRLLNCNESKQEDARCDRAADDPDCNVPVLQINYLLAQRLVGYLQQVARALKNVPELDQLAAGHTSDSWHFNEGLYMALEAYLEKVGKPAHKAAVSF